MSTITLLGDKNPKIGAPIKYVVFSAIPIVNEKWVLYEGNKKIFEKSSGDVTFLPLALGKSYRFEVTYESLIGNQKGRSEIAIVPIVGEPVIVGMHWEDCNYRKLGGKEAQVAYLDPLYLVIQTANIPRGEKLEITVYEDEYKSGHGDTSVKMDDILYAVVKKSGKAELELSSEILRKFMDKADANDLFWNDLVHDYYVQIKYNDKLHVIKDKTQVKVKNTLERLVKPVKGERVVTLDEEEIEVKKNIIFPLLQKPDNDIDKKWGKNYYWGANIGANQTTYMSNRSNGKRKHAARDLYTPPLTPVVAIADGIVLSVSSFYCSTNQVTVKHKTEDKREFIIRYGELDPSSITVKDGNQIKQGKIIGKTGKLVGISVISKQDIYMLHFEHFTGKEGLDLKNPLTDNSLPFMRRKDLVDPLAILKEGYRNAFEDEQDEEENDRVHPSELTTSEKGILFIKDWEKFRDKLYDNDADQNGNTTIGYGHLVHKGKINGSESKEYINGITEEMASNLLKKDLKRMENAITRDVSVKLYQYEFDALVSLLFNAGEFFLTRGSKGKTTQLLLKLNDRNYMEAAIEFLDITNGNKSGLVKRRKAENNMFLNNIYDSSH